MKKRHSLTLAILLMIASTGMAQGTKFTGTWTGILHAGSELHFVFHIYDNGKGSLESSADSPDQSTYGIKCDTTVINGDNILVEMHGLNASFTGKLVNDSSLEGTFKQVAELPLLLKRKKEINEKLTDNTPVPNTRYKTMDVSVKTKNATISGSLFNPLTTEKPPVVLIIAGSGPTDRDGNSAVLPGKNNSLLQLADSLSMHGIASLRYDKRGVGQSKLSPGVNEENITIDDMAGDAVALYAWLETQGYKDIFIAGHSEGSLIGILTARKVKLKGFISIAGAGRKAGDILKEQLAGQFPPLVKKEFDADIDSLEHGLDVLKVNPSLLMLVRKSVQPYMKSWLPLDPKQLISELKCPVLVMQGTKDIQVTQGDAQNLYKANPKAKLVLVNNMNHVMKEVVSDDKNDNIKAYMNPELPVVTELVRSIVNFIRGVPR